MVITYQSVLGLDFTVTGDRFDPKKLRESWLWPNQRLIKNNKLLKARNLNDNSERLVDSTEFIQRHSLLIPQAFNIFQRFSPTYTCIYLLGVFSQQRKKNEFV